MSTKRRSYTRFLSCLLAFCLLLSIIPATAESPATPTDLGPVVEEVQESGEPEAAGEGEQAETTGDPEDPDGASVEDGLPSAEEAEEADPVEEDPDETNPVEADPDKADADETDPDEADPAETEPVVTDPFLATLKAGARLYADKDCYRKQQVLAEAAVVLVVKTEENASEILYAYPDAEDRVVPGKAYARVADLTPLTEEETAAWQAAAHPEAVERRGFMLEPVTFGTEEEPEKTEGAAAGSSEAEEAGEEPAEAFEEAGEEPEDGQDITTENRTGRLSAEKAGEKIDVSTAVPATPTDLSALSGAGDAGADELSGDSQTITTDLPAIRDQNPFGACWAFAAIGAMEIYLIKTDSAVASEIDLSELYLAYYIAHDYPEAKPGGEGDQFEFVGGGSYLDNGGTNYLAFRILENLIGTVAETSAQYTPNPKSPTADSQVVTQMTGAYVVNVNKQSVGEIKELIRTHGSVSASIWMPEQAYYNKIENVNGPVGYSSTNACLYGRSRTANHDILLVGWDDGFSRNNFVDGLRPENDGAWKARNSWGTGFGNSGYFWISYEDYALAGTDATVYRAINSSSKINGSDNKEEVPDFCYSYDKIPDNDAYEDSTAWVLKAASPAVMEQVFTIDGNEKILSVGVETGTAGVRIDVTVKVKPTDGTGPEVTATGVEASAAYRGFYRIRLNNPLEVAVESTATVTVKYTAAGKTIIVPYEPKNKRYTANGYRYTTGQGSDGFRFGTEGQLTDHKDDDSSIKVYTKRASGSATDVTLSCLLPSIASDKLIRISNATSGQTYQLTASVSGVRWQSTDQNVAKVDAAGKVTIGKRAGETQITATTSDGGVATCKITVKNSAPDSIKFRKGDKTTISLTLAEEPNLKIGDTLEFIAQTYPDYAAEKGVEWVSSNTAVLGVVTSSTRMERSETGSTYVPTSIGKIAIRGNGTARLTVRSLTNPNISSYIDVKVDLTKKEDPPAPPPPPAPVRVSSVSLNRTGISLTEGDGAQLSATVYPSNAANKNVSWTSSNNGIVTVNSSGYITAVKAGSATVTVTTSDGGRSASCSVTVSPRDLVVAFVTRMYQICLRRQPDQIGLNDWVGKLKNHERTGAGIAQGFYFSPEMINSGLSNREFATRAYEGLLGRQPDAVGLADWTSRLDGGASRESIIAGFTNSVEFGALCEYYGIVRGEFPGGGGGSSVPAGAGVTGLVTRFYTTMLGRAADPIGMNGWTNEIMATPTQQKVLWVALTGFMHSDEFLAKGLSNEEFVKVLYRTFLDRECDPIGLAGWVADLQAGKSRDSIASGFAYSQEFAGIMASYGF